jgi:hypothetical protein
MPAASASATFWTAPDRPADNADMRVDTRQKIVAQITLSVGVKLTTVRAAVTVTARNTRYWSSAYP